MANELPPTGVGVGAGIRSHELGTIEHVVGGGHETHDPLLGTPDTIRAPNFVANAGTLEHGSATNTPWHPTLLSQLNAGATQVVAEIQKLLSTSLLDWAVTPKDARRALEKLETLSADERAAAVEKLGPELLNKLEENLAFGDRAAHRASIEEMRSYRNSGVAPPDFQAFLAKTQVTLQGVLGLDRVSAADARQIMDGLRRFGPAEFEAILDAIGPDKVARLQKRLSLTDKAVYAATIQRFEGVFFGNVKRAEEAAGLGAQDRGGELVDILKNVQAGRDKLGPAAQQFVYLLAPGLVTEHQPGYFEENKKRMEQRGLTVRISKLDTDADVPTNAKTLSDEIQALARETGKKVIVLSHSKGGPDAALALRDPKAAEHTALFISMQAAYGGTPISDPLMDGVLGDGLKRALVNVLGATNGNAFSDLSFGAQKARWKKLPPLEVPVLNLATSLGRPSALEIVANTWRDLFGIKSDGLVPLDSQVIGGKRAWVSYLEGVDHAGPAARPLAGPLAPKYPPGDLTEALILQGLRLIGAA